MRKYDDLSLEEKVAVAKLGNNFRKNHESYVANLIKIAEKEIAPSGSDLFHPELWKPMHWKWFSEPESPCEEW